MKKRSALEDIETGRAAAEAEIAAATAELAKLADDRTAALRSGDDTEIDTVEDKIRLANRTIERARARVDVLTADLEAERARHAAAEQARLETRADEVATKAASLMEQALDQFRPAFRQALRAQALADLMIEAANKSRSTDLPPLLSVEARYRERSMVPRAFGNEERVQLWSFIETGQRLGQEAQGRVVSKDGKTGTLPIEGTLMSAAAVVKRSFIKRCFQPAVRFPSPDPLVETTSIPGVRAGDEPIWGAIDHSTPEKILETLDRLEADHGRDWEVELAPVEDSATADEAAA